MTRKSVAFKWQVAEAPTGPYKSFHWRGWPSATSTSPEGLYFGIRCLNEWGDQVDYSPRAVREGTHPPLKIWMRNDVARDGKIRTFKKEFATLAEAKDFVSKLDAAKILAEWV